MMGALSAKGYGSSEISARDNASMILAQTQIQKIYGGPEDNLYNGGTEGMNPVEILNNLSMIYRFKLKYGDSVKSGSDHLPHFKIMATVKGQEFIGTGGSKAKAKRDAAKKALDFF